jgi:hypothetical protein
VLLENVFARLAVVPSWWANAIQKRVSTGAVGFRIRLKNTTTIEVPAGPDDAAAILDVAGHWRWNEATVERAVGGAAGTYVIWATALNNSIVSQPQPGTDTTNRAFGLIVLANGTAPVAQAGVQEIFRRVGRLVWDGTKITYLVQEVAQLPAAALPDEIVPARGGVAAGTEALRALGTTAATAAAGNDPRLSDARTPTAHQHPISDVQNLQTVLDGKVDESSSANRLYGTDSDGGQTLRVVSATATAGNVPLYGSGGIMKVANGVAADDAVALGQLDARVPFDPRTVPIVTVTTASRTLVLSDMGKLVETTTGGASVGITIPADATTNFPIGTVIEVRRGSGANAIISGANGVSLLSPTFTAPSSLFITDQWATASLHKRDVNQWVVSGAVTA